MSQYIRRQFSCRKGGVDPCKGADLLGRGGAYTGKAGVKSLAKGRSLCKKSLDEPVFVHGQRVFFVHGVRNKISPSRQHFTHGTHLGGHMLDAVDDLIFRVAEDNIAVFSHDLHHQLLAAGVPQFVQMLNVQPDDPLQPGLGDIHDPPVPDMLAQKHTEVGSRHGAGLIVLRQIDKGEGCAGRKVESFLPCRRLYGEKKFVRLRLGDLGDAPLAESFL